MKLLVCDHYTPEALSRLQAIGKVQKAKGFQPLQEELDDSSALLIRSRTRVDADLIKRSPQLKYIITATSGFDHIDFEACEAAKIKVAYTPEANAASASELTWALILNLVRSVTSADKSVRRHEWKDQLTKAHNLQGLQLGIVGLGRIGKRVAKMAQAFEMRVTAYDPYIESSLFNELNIEALSLIEVLLSSDIITLHVPLTPETRQIINHQTLEHINPEAYLINVARGELINETELAIRMEKGMLRGAALDVFEKEPLSQDSRLRSLKNVLLTPHIGAYTLEAFEKASQMAVDELFFMIEGQHSPNQLPLQTGWFELWRKALKK